MKNQKRSVDKYIDERFSEEAVDSLKDYAPPHKMAECFQGVAAHAYISMSELWELSNEDAEALLEISPKTFSAWIAGDTRNLSADSLEKISCLMGMYKHLGTLYSGQIPRVGRWLHCKNKGEPFCGSSPFDYLAHAKVDRFYKVLRSLAAATV